MANNKWIKTDNETPTNPSNRSRDRPPTDTDHTVGQLMVENLNHRRRIEVLEERLRLVETAQKNSSFPPGSSIIPASRRSQLFSLARKTVIVVSVVIAALISALKELGFLK